MSFHWPLIIMFSLFANQTRRPQNIKPMRLWQVWKFCVEVFSKKIFQMWRRPYTLVQVFTFKNLFPVASQNWPKFHGGYSVCDNWKCDFSFKITTNITVVLKLNFKFTFTIQQRTSTHEVTATLLLIWNFRASTLKCVMYVRLAKVAYASYLAKVTCASDFHK